MAVSARIIRNGVTVACFEFSGEGLGVGDFVRSVVDAADGDIHSGGRLAIGWQHSESGTKGGSSQRRGKGGAVDGTEVARYGSGEVVPVVCAGCGNGYKDVEGKVAVDLGGSFDGVDDRREVEDVSGNSDGGGQGVSEGNGESKELPCGSVSGGSERLVGVNTERNRRWRSEAKSRKVERQARGEFRGWRQSSNWRARGSVQSSGSSEFSVGVCRTVKEESDIEKQIREASEKRRLVEAKLAARKAELVLERMNDKTMTELYNSRVKQEDISRMNLAICQSEKNLERLRSVSPGSSATPGEIRQALLESESWKAKEKKINAWVAAGEPKGVIAGILSEGKSTEISSMDTDMKELCAEHGYGPGFADEVAAEEAALLEQERVFESKAGERAAQADKRNREYLNYVKGRSENEGFKCGDHLADWEIEMMAEMAKEAENKV